MSLQALKEDKISYKQFATIMLFNSISQKYEEKNYNVVPIFLTDGTLNIEALDAIIQTLFVAGEDSNSDIFRLSPLKLAKWIELMKICPESEKCFFSIPNETVGIISRISEGLEENTFVHYNGLQDQKLRMIPSLSMKQNYLNVLNPKDAITITPKIGLSTLEEIEENGLISTRDEGIPFQGLSLPKEADGFEAPEDWDFNQHDFYHACLVTCIPDGIRKLTIDIEKKFHNFINSILDEFSNTSYVKRLSDSVKEKCIDMEFTYFKTSFFSKKNDKENEFLFNFLQSLWLNFIVIHEKLKKEFTNVHVELQANIIEKFSTILISELKKIIPVPKESIDLLIIEAQESKLNYLFHVSHQLADIFLQQVANLIS